MWLPSLASSWIQFTLASPKNYKQSYFIYVLHLQNIVKDTN